MRNELLAAFLLALALAHATASAQSLSYAGRLTGQDGKPVVGPVDLKITFFGAESGGAALPVGPLAFAKTALADGVFHVDLGLSAEDAHTLFDSAAAQVWIEVTDATHELAYPRQRFEAVPIALKVPIDDGKLSWTSDGKLTVSAIAAGDVAGLSAALAAKADASALASKAESATVTAALALKADTTALTAGLATKAASGHSHTLAGDVGGDAGTTSVAKLQGQTLTMGGSAPTSGFVLKWNGSAWTPQADLNGTGGTSESTSATNLGAGAGVYKQLLGSYQIEFRSLADTATIDATENANDITLALKPDAPLDTTGNVTVRATGGNATELRLLDGDNSNRVSVKAPAVVPADFTLTLPDAPGTAGQILTTAGATGVLSWSSPSTTLPPNGAAGGSLAGSYPNPTIAAGAVTTTEIAADTIVAGDIAAGAVDNAELAANAVTTGKITDGTIATADIAANAITTAEIAVDTIVAADIAASAVDNSELAANAVTSAKITDGTIAAADLGANAVTGAKLASDAAIDANRAVGTDHIKDGAITAAKLAADSLGAGQLANNSVTTAEITDATIATADIAANAITTAEIAVDTILAADIAASAVDNSELAANAVTSAKITDGTVALADLAGNAVDSSKIVDGTIVAADLGLVNHSVSGDKIDGGTISNFASTGIDDNAAAVAVTISSAGNVGIGNTGPVYAPFVVGNAAAYPSNTSGIASGRPFSAATSAADLGNLYLFSTDAVAADKGGVLSFGTQYDTLGAGGLGDTRVAAIAGLKDNGTAGQYGGYLAMYTRAHNAFPAERMRIDSAGQVGIGTNAPGAKLDVRRAAGEYGAIANFRGESFTAGDGSTRISISDVTGNVDWFPSANNDGSFAIHQGGVGDRLRIDSSGRVILPAQITVNAAISGGPANNDGTNFLVSFGNTRYSNAGAAWTGSRFTAPVAGVYMINTNFMTSQNGSIGNADIYVGYSGGGGRWLSRTHGSGHPYTMAASVTPYLNVGDYIEVYASRIHYNDTYDIGSIAINLLH